MAKLFIVLSILSLFAVLSRSNDIFEGLTDDNDIEMFPTVMIAILIRNKAHVLPWFLKYIENLDYPKDRIIVWIRSDHNEDDSANIAELWVNKVRNSYHYVDYFDDNSTREYPGQQSPIEWTKQRFYQVIKLRQEALDTARKYWADYLLFVDADNILTNSDVLNQLIAQKKVIVGPLLNTGRKTSAYSNFWAGMDQQGYYKRTLRYESILRRQLLGCHSVPMVHSTLLINLKDTRSALLSYDTPPLDYTGPLDDIIIFASVARYHGIPMYVLNTQLFGYLLEPANADDPISIEQEQFLHLKLENIVSGTPLEKLSYIPTVDSTRTKLGFDKIYVINLKRRRDRYQKMVDLFTEMALDVEFVEAVDGKELNMTYLKDLGVEMLPDYLDPYHKRPMKMGEIGCFLSHYKIWQDVDQNNYDKVLVLEDDVRFVPYFRSRVLSLLEEIDKITFYWDLIYVGRKKLVTEVDNGVDDVQYLVWPDYSYWTVGYIVNGRGAAKLIDQQPLGKMVPVDEYLPIMYDKHPEEAWKAAFEPRNLVTLSAEPLLVEPAYYMGQAEYVTDTEDSEVISTSDNKVIVEQPEPPTVFKHIHDQEAL